jgi:4'-phosphopantetheinyl transferase
VARRVVLRDVLSCYLAVPATSIEIDRCCRHCGNPAHGKPRLAGRESRGLEFSLSQAGDLVLVAVTTSGEVGLDVEGTDAGSDWEVVADHVFTRAERARLDLVSEHRRHLAFLTAWTIKEACLKADGRGLVVGADAVEVLVDPASPDVAPTVRGTAAWQVATFFPADGYVSTLASSEPVQLAGWELPSDPP